MKRFNGNLFDHFPIYVKPTTRGLTFRLPIHSVFLAPLKLLTIVLNFIDFSTPLANTIINLSHCNALVSSISLESSSVDSHFIVRTHYEEGLTRISSYPKYLRTVLIFPEIHSRYNKILRRSSR